MPKKEHPTIVAANIQGKYSLIGVLITVIGTLLVGFFVFITTPFGQNIVFPATMTPTLSLATLPSPSIPPVIETSTITPEVPTLSPTPDDGAQLVGIVDNYYSCINSAKHDSDRDYYECWNLLSKEYQVIYENISHVKGYKSLMNFWNDYKIGYALYYCPKINGKFVDVTYYRYQWNDTSTPISDARVIMEYSFGYNNGWNITSGNSTLEEISPDCEDNPRIERWTPSNP